MNSRSLDFRPACLRSTAPSGLDQYWPGSGAPNGVVGSTLDGMPDGACDGVQEMFVVDDGGPFRPLVETACPFFPSFADFFKQK